MAQGIFRLVRLADGAQTSGMQAPDRQHDDPLGERWISLAELAKARGTSKESAARLVRRKNWRRQPDNRGMVQVLVPLEELEPSPTHPQGGPPGILAAEGAWPVVQLALLAQQRAESRADRLDEALARERVRADALAAELAAERARADSLAATLTERDAELATLKGGFLVRLRRSWRIRRGS
jgi:hypothetical protein